MPREADIFHPLISPLLPPSGLPLGMFFARASLVGLGRARTLQFRDPAICLLRKLAQIFVLPSRFAAEMFNARARVHLGISRQLIVSTPRVGRARSGLNAARCVGHAPDKVQVAREIARAGKKESPLSPALGI